MEIILGSQSPRRKEILSFFDIPFKQVCPDFKEEEVPFFGDPIAYVTALAKGKADILRLKYHDALIITADTIVFKDSKIYGKPENDLQAVEFLKDLEGKWHSVFTGVNVSIPENEFHDVEETRVLFNPLTEKQIQNYHQKLHYSDKAGGYMIQQAGGIIVQKIDGCYYNVMGFPINTLRHLLLKAGIDLWNHLPSK